jgi:hypothetical protein
MWHCGDSNNLVLWLRPAPVVVKVATGQHRRLGLELAVATHLLAQGGPVITPAENLPQAVHHLGDWEVTFWTYQPHGSNEPDPTDVGGALGGLDEALLSYQGPLPSYGDELSVVAEVLTGTAHIAALPAADRQLLASALHRFLAELEQLDSEERAWQHLLSLALEAGDLVRARRGWTACQEALADLGVEPGEPLQAMARQIDAAAHITQPWSLAATAQQGRCGGGLGQAPLVGRAGPLATLRRAFARASRSGPACRSARRSRDR